MSTAPTLSVVLPTRGRSATLRIVLDRLYAERGEPAREVVVVHDGEPSDPGLDARFPGIVQLETGAQGGPAAARNLGAQRARGELLVFLDDDVEPAPGALALLRAELQARPAAAVAARIEPAPGVARNHYLRFAYAGVAHGGARPGPVSCTHVCSSFLGLSRGRFLAAGGFNPTLRFYEDVELGHRLGRRGLDLLLSAGVVGLHRREMDREWFLARCESLGPHLRRLHRLHPELAALLPAGPRRGAGALCVGGGRAWSLWRALLPVAESLPWPLARGCLRAVHAAGTAMSYRGLIAAGGSGRP